MRRFKTIQSDAIDQPLQYKLLSGAVIPRPIALITTSGPAGTNAAPFSFFNAICTDPPMVVFSAGPRGTDAGWQDKDTIRNIRASGEFVVHVVSRAMLQQMTLCGFDFDAGTSEIERAGLTCLPSSSVAPPRLAEAPVHLECRAAHVMPLGRRNYAMVVAEVVCFHFDETVLDARWRVDADTLDPLGRLAGDQYAGVADRVRMPRPATLDEALGLAAGRAQP